MKHNDRLYRLKLISAATLCTFLLHEAVGARVVFAEALQNTGSQVQIPSTGQTPDNAPGVTGEWQESSVDRVEPIPVVLVTETLAGRSSLDIYLLEEDMRSRVGRSSGESGFDPRYDLDGNGSISGLDRIRLRIAIPAGASNDTRFIREIQSWLRPNGHGRPVTETPESVAADLRQAHASLLANLGNASDGRADFDQDGRTTQSDLTAILSILDAAGLRYESSGFDLDGVHQLTGTLYDENGYARDGYNAYGMDRQGSSSPADRRLYWSTGKLQLEYLASEGSTHEYRRDGRLKRTVRSDRTAVSYDEAGNVERRDQADGSWTKYYTSGKDRMVYDILSGKRSEYADDAARRLLAVWYDLPDETGAVSYRYDHLGRVTMMRTVTGESIETTFRYQEAPSSDVVRTTGQDADGKYVEPLPWQVIKNSEVIYDSRDNRLRTLLYTVSENPHYVKKIIDHVILDPTTGREREYNCNNSFDCTEMLFGIQDGWNLINLPPVSVEVIESRDLTYIPALNTSPHATQVVSLIGAMSNPFADIIGGTPDWVNVTFALTLDETVAAIDAAVVARRPVINISMEFNIAGLTAEEIAQKRASLQQALTNAKNNGTIVVAAAGNNNLAERLSFVQGFEDVIVVGGVDFAGRHPFSSNVGSALDFVMPSVQILSWAIDKLNRGASGTSYAAPLVASSIAKIIGFDLQVHGHRTLTWENVYDLLKDTAHDLGRLGHDARFGWGLLNPVAAIQSLRDLWTV